MYLHCQARPFRAVVDVRVQMPRKSERPALSLKIGVTLLGWVPWAFRWVVDVWPTLKLDVYTLRLFCL